MFIADMRLRGSKLLTSELMIRIIMTTVPNWYPFLFLVQVFTWIHVDVFLHVKLQLSSLTEAQVTGSSLLPFKSVEPDGKQPTEDL